MKVAVVGGAGRVGATTLFQLLLDGIAQELAVVDVVTERAEGEMLDMLHGTHLSQRVKFSGPDYDACEGADFVIITAGIPRKPDETRLDLLKKNVDNLRDNVLPTLSKHAGNAFIIMVANPADVLTYQAAVHGAFPPERVIGTGTLLDSTRLRSLLADRLDVDPRQVFAYMLGEHGDSQYPYLSGASVAGIPLEQFPGYSKAMVDEVVNATRFGGAEVIKKGRHVLRGRADDRRAGQGDCQRLAPGAASFDSVERRIPGHERRGAVAAVRDRQARPRQDRAAAARRR